MADDNRATVFAAREIGVTDLHNGLRLGHLKMLVHQATALDYRDDSGVIVTGMAKLSFADKKDEVQIVGSLIIREGPD